MRSTVDYSTPSPSYGGLPSPMVRGPSQVHPRRRRHSSAPASQRCVANGGHGDRMNGTIGSHQHSHQHPAMIRVLEDPNDTATAAAIAAQELQENLGADLDDEDDASICDYFSSGPARSVRPGYGTSASTSTYGQHQYGPGYGNSNNTYGQHGPAGIQKPVSNNVSQPKHQVQQQHAKSQAQQPHLQSHPKMKKDKKSWTQLFSGLNLSSELERGVSLDSNLTASTVLSSRSSLSSSNHSANARNWQAPSPPQKPQNLSSSSRSAPRRRMSGVAICTAAAGAVADILSQPEETRGGDRQQAATTFSTGPPPLHRHEFQPPRRRGSGEHARGHRRTQRRHSYHPGSSAAQSQNTNTTDSLFLSHNEFLRMKEELRNSSVLTNAGVQQVMARRSSVEHKKANDAAAAHLEEQQRLQNLREQNQSQDSQNADKKNRFFQKGKEALFETGFNGFNALQNVLVKTLEDELAFNSAEIHDNDPMNMMVGEGSRHRRSITSTTSSLSNTNHSVHSQRRVSSRRVSYHSQYSESMEDDGSCLLATHGALSTYEHDSLNSGADFFMNGINQ